MKKQAKQSTGRTQKQKDSANRMFTLFKEAATGANCVHYCSIGGHLWYHTPPNDGKLPECPYRTTAGAEIGTIKFFRICGLHFKKRKPLLNVYLEEEDF
jgi:hypothetical protein